MKSSAKIQLKLSLKYTFRNLHFVRTVIPLGRIRSDSVKDSHLLESCIRSEGKSHLKTKPNFRICYLPSQVTKLEQTQQFIDSEPPCIAMSIPQFHSYSEQQQRMEQKVVVDSVYLSGEVEVAIFFCPVPKFPDSIGKYSLRDLVLNPPNGMLLFYHPSFEIHDIFPRYQSMFKESCKILCCVAGVFGDNRAYVFPSGDDGSQEMRQLGQFGAAGLIFYGDITSEDMAWLARRISGRYLLGSVMSPVLQKTLFVPRSSPKKLTAYMPNTTIKSVPMFTMGEIIFPGTILPVNIFEPRYKIMVKEHLETGRPFGIKLNRARVGTLVRVESIMSLNPVSGESTVRLRGLSRFRVLDSPRRLTPLRMEDDKFGLFSADVECFEDNEVSAAVAEGNEDITPLQGGPTLSALVAEAKEVCSVLSSYDDSLVEDLEHLTLEQLSHLMCFMCSLDMPVFDRQKLLELVDSPQRLASALAYYRTVVKTAPR